MASAMLAGLTDYDVSVRLLDIDSYESLASIPSFLRAGEGCLLATSEELLIQDMLDAAGCVYNGSTAMINGLFYDKFASYAVAARVGARVPMHSMLAVDDATPLLDDPSAARVVKPRYGGGSVGVSFLPDGLTSDDLGSSTRQWLVEEHLSGSEITVLFHGPNLVAISTVDFEGALFDHSSKEHMQVEYTIHTHLNPLTTEVAASCEHLARTTGIAGLWRSDWRQGRDGYVLMDVNTLPFLGNAVGGFIATLCEAYDLQYVDLLRAATAAD